MSERSKQKYYERKANKLCTRCGKPVDEAREGKTVCSECAEKLRIKYSKGERPRKTTEEKKEYNRRWRIETYKKRKELGICWRCSKPVDDGSIRCSECRKINQEYRKRTYHNRKNNNCCVNCGKQLVGDDVNRAYCQECADKKNAMARAKYKTNKEREYEEQQKAAYDEIFKHDRLAKGAA